MKNEFIAGVVGALLVLALTVAYGSQYLSKQQSLASLSSSTAGTSPTGSQQEGTKLTGEEVAKHNNEKDCWLIISGAVYNVTSYIPIHPGGANRIIPSCGTDATEAFMTQGGQGQHSQDAVDALKLFYIGDLNGAVTAQPDTTKIQQLPVGRGEENDERK